MNVEPAPTGRTSRRPKPAATRVFDDQTFVVSGGMLLAMQDCLVYSWWREDVCLYVGQSKRGIQRTLRDHHVIGVVEAVISTDNFYYRNVPEDRLGWWERKWIEAFRPVLNIANNPYKREIPDYVKETDRRVAELEKQNFNKKRGKPSLLGKYCAYDCDCEFCSSLKL